MGDDNNNNENKNKVVDNNNNENNNIDRREYFVTLELVVLAGATKKVRIADHPLNPHFHLINTRICCKAM